MKADRLDDVFLCFSVRVSNELGLGHPRTAKYSIYVALFQSFLIGIVCMFVIIDTKNYYAVIFTDSPAMQRVVASLSGLLGITMLLNSIQPVISGKYFVDNVRLSDRAKHIHLTLQFINLLILYMQA